MFTRLVWFPIVFMFKVIKNEAYDANLSSWFYWDKRDVDGFSDFKHFPIF